MKKRENNSAPAVKIGTSRQVVIPKKLHDALGLQPGDYLQVELSHGRVVLTPKTLVDKRVEQGIAESMGDFAAGRSYGPFDSVEEMIRSLHTHVRTRRGSRKARR